MTKGRLLYPLSANNVAKIEISSLYYFFILLMSFLLCFFLFSLLFCIPSLDDFALTTACCTEGEY